MTARTVRIEPSPYKKIGINIKQKKAVVNNVGQAIKDSNDQIRSVDADLDSLVRVPGTSKLWAPAISPNGIKTGLTRLVDNPYKDETAYHPSWGEKVLKGKDKVLLQHVLEYKHGKEFDYYTNKLYDRIESSTKNSELPFFLSDQRFVPLTNDVLFLNLDNPIHEVWYHALKDSKICANSFEELAEGKNNDAWWYINDSDSAYDPNYENTKRMNKAVGILEKLAEDASGLYMMARCLGDDRRNITKDDAYKYINNFFSAKAKGKAETNYDTFLKYYELYQDATRREYFIGTAKLRTYLAFNIVRERDNKYYWVKPESDTSPMRTFEWSSEDDFVRNFLTAPEFEDEVKILDSLYESRKSN